jgi:arginase
MTTHSDTGRRLAVLDTPSNLGLRPPVPGAGPGCYKLAGALRDHKLLDRLGAEDAGYVTPPRYDRQDWTPGDGVANASGIASYSVRLADRVGLLVDAARFPFVLGGDCSILRSTTLALRRRGRYGLAFLDGHTDFRHLGNSPAVGAAAGEDLALVTGRGQDDLTNLEGRSPYLRDADVVVLRVRDADEHVQELARHEIAAWPVARLQADTKRLRLHSPVSNATRSTGSGSTSTPTSSPPRSCPQWAAPTLAESPMTN